jgi:hypothetical protein
MTTTENIPVDTRVAVIGLRWGESDSLLYDASLIGKTGKVVDHEEEYYTPNNVVEIDGGEYSYFLPNECLKIIED